MTMWTERRFGDGPAMGATRADILPEEPNALLIHDGVPDWIRDPITNRQVRVEGTTTNPPKCPHCQGVLPTQGRVLLTERDGHPDEQLLVIECPHEGKYVIASLARSPGGSGGPPR